MEELGLDYTELQKTVEELLPNGFPVSFEQLVAGLSSGESGGLLDILKEIGQWLLQSVSFPVEHGMRLLFMILFSALFSNLSKAFSKDGTSHIGFLCVYLLMALHATTGFSSALTIATEGMENLCTFISVLLPVYCICIAFVTGSVTAVGYYRGTVLLLGFFEFLTRYCLIPLCRVYLMLALASCMQKKPIFDKLLGLICSLFSWVRKTLIGIALALGAVQGVLCPAIDNLKRNTVVQAASAIPGVGNLVGGAWETVLGAGYVLKNAIGIGGVIILLLICSLPLLQLGMQYLTYRILAAVTEPVTQDMTEQFLTQAGMAHKLLFQTLSAGMYLFLLMLVVMTRISS